MSEQGGVRSYQGLDALTGLPVLIYRFGGRPMPSVGDLESDNIPGILHWSYDGQQGEVVTAFAPSYKPLRAPIEAPGVLALLLDSVTALKDAAHAGVLHGNLKPGRFLRANGHHLIEGYGVRWKPEVSPFTAPDALEGASYAGDVFSWARSVEALCGTNLPEELVPLIEASLSVEPHERPLAKTLHEAVSILVGAVMRDTGTSIAPHITGVFEPYREEPAAASGGAGWEPTQGGAAEGEAEVFTAQEASDPEERGGAPLRAPLLKRREEKLEGHKSDPGFIRHLPPGATYRDGLTAESLPPAPIVLPDDEKRGVGFKAAKNRRPLLLAALIVAVAILAVLAFLWQRPSEFAVPTYPVTLSVQPEGLRGVRVVVVSSPPDSALQRDREILNVNVPGQVPLERGEWVLRASSLNRVSPNVRFSVPEERNVVFLLQEN